MVWLLLLLGLVSWAFFTKSSSLRWVTLGATLLYLGFVDGGFLSVSHIIAWISVGPGVYLTDLPLLLIVTFTVGTTLLWGGSFAGFCVPSAPSRSLSSGSCRGASDAACRERSTTTPCT